MALVHGKKTYLSLGGTDISQYANESEITRGADSHDVTTYGKNSHVVAGGLGKGSASVSGLYDSTAVSGPRALINPKVGTVVELIRRPEGTGAGLPQDKVDVLVEEYVETSPVAEYVKWSVKLTLSDDVDTTAQAV